MYRRNLLINSVYNYPYPHTMIKLYLSREKIISKTYFLTLSIPTTIIVSPRTTYSFFEDFLTIFININSPYAVRCDKNFKFNRAFLTFLIELYKRKYQAISVSSWKIMMQKMCIFFSFKYNYSTIFGTERIG